MPPAARDLTLDGRDKSVWVRKKLSTLMSEALWFRRYAHPRWNKTPAEGWPESSAGWDRCLGVSHNSGAQAFRIISLVGFAANRCQVKMVGIAQQQTRKWYRPIFLSVV